MNQVDIRINLLLIEAQLALNCYIAVLWSYC